MNKKILFTTFLFTNIIFSQTVIDFKGQDFSSDSGYKKLGNNFEISNYRFSSNPNEICADEEHIIMFKEGFSTTLSIESIDKSNFKLDNFYFEGVDDSNITLIEGFKNQVSQGIQNSGFTQQGIQTLNSVFNNINKLTITVEAITNFSNVFGILDDIVIKPVSTLSHKGITSNKNKIIFSNRKFSSLESRILLEVYNISGTKISNENLFSGLYFVKIIKNNGEINFIKFFVQ